MTRNPFAALATAMLLVRLGWRNLWRYKRRNGMLCLAVAVAVASILLASSLIRGLQAEMKEDVVDALVGDIKITQPGFLANPQAAATFAVAEHLPEALTAGGIGWDARLVLPTVIMSERETRGVQLAGIDPVTAVPTTFLRRAHIDGRMLRGTGDNRLLLGAEMARRLETRIGKRVVVRVTRIDGSSAETGLTICGLFDAQGTSLELGFAFVGRDTLQALVGGRGMVSEVALLVPTGQTSTWLRALREQLPDKDVRTWRELMPQTAAIVDLADAGIWLISLMLTVGLAFGVANTLIAAVLERTREIGLLHVLGMARRAIVAQVVLESLWIMLLGLICGFVLGVVCVAWLREGIDLSQWSAGMQFAGMRTLLVPQFAAKDFGIISAIVMSLGALGSLYPAWRAVKLDPLEALHGRT